MSAKQKPSRFTFVKPTIEEHDVDQSQFNELVRDLQSSMRDFCGNQGLSSEETPPQGRIETALRKLYDEQGDVAPLPAELIREYTAYRLGYDIPVGKNGKVYDVEPVEIHRITVDVVERSIKKLKQATGDKLGTEVAKKICATVDTAIQDELRLGKGR